MLKLYRFLLSQSTPLLEALLARRLKRGKEDPERLQERKGQSTLPRPPGLLVWIHAASVGEAQSALILIDRMIKSGKGYEILLTTGTVTSAGLMKKNLPSSVLHQFFPLDHPQWVERFLNHWRPDLIFWMESELWPNMLAEIKSRNIPAALLNARLSKRSYARWKFVSFTAREVLSAFNVILAQTEQDARYYRSFGAAVVTVTDNLKYSAKALPADETDLRHLLGHIQGRPVWVYASTHRGEELLAARIHERLKATLSSPLTIIVPRHPARRDEIRSSLEKTGLHMTFRGDAKTLPDHDTDLYIADTMGELGLFYRAAPIACIGRSFSEDGGGGHNPIEAAQLNCAVLHGPHVQYQQRLFDDMMNAGACKEARSEAELAMLLQKYLSDPQAMESFQKTCFGFARTREKVIDNVMACLTPLFEALPYETARKMS